MSFTSQVQPIGGERGVNPTPETDIDPIYVGAVGDLPAGAVGSEGSSDDPQEIFPDTFVDMAKESEESVDRDPPKEKKKPFFKSKKKESDEEDLEELPDEEVL